MKGIIAYLLVLTITIYSCGNRKQEILNFDTENDYPEKEVLLDDICDISYVPIDNKEVVSGRPRLVTNKVIIYSNRNGDILVFNRNGKYLHKFNHKGNGPGEYPYIGKVIYDKHSDNLIITHDNKIITYTLFGEFLKEHTVDPNYFLWDIKDYTNETLLANNSNSLSSAYLIISKTSGKIIDSIGVESSIMINPSVQIEEGGMKYSYMPSYFNIVKGKDGFFINNISSDTFFVLSENRIIKPYLKRLPSIKEQFIPIFLNSWVETSIGYFVSTVKREFDPKNKDGFEQKYYLIDKKCENIYQVKIVNNDIENIDLNIDPSIIERSPDSSLGLKVLSADDLINARDRKEIHSSTLKAIVKNIDEDSNPVLMFMKFK